MPENYNKETQFEKASEDRCAVASHGGLQLSIKVLAQTGCAIHRAVYVVQRFLTACVQFRRYVAELR